MRTISATKFKEQCLSLLDQVNSEGIVITKHGKPVAKLVPLKTNWGEFIGCMRDEITIRGDILSAGLAWDAES